jgi:hypothetical protein
VVRWRKLTAELQVIADKNREEEKERQAREHQENPNRVITNAEFMLLKQQVGLLGARIKELELQISASGKAKATKKSS